MDSATPPSKAVKGEGKAISIGSPRPKRPTFPFRSQLPDRLPDSRPLNASPPIHILILSPAIILTSHSPAVRGQLGVKCARPLREENSEREVHPITRFIHSRKYIFSSLPSPSADPLFRRNRSIVRLVSLSTSQSINQSLSHSVIP